ncbi:FERM and PDZ domain-containing protein 1 [Bombina bombina]|uniref:FERM and PDZ domain-containing protein 1 n=1 Tax=Bombina bombina TaxID=8345 RepID=UPI00235A8087|nr:FERM and PDZ domain-containing protein 1 [Bombina bombina]
MEDTENIFQTRKGRRIEQMVVRWLRRSRDNATRGKSSTGDESSAERNQRGGPQKLTLFIQKDILLHHYGFDISRNPPLTITAVTAGSPAEGKLFPGDQILRINNENVENIPIEQAADLVRDSADSLTVTVLRNTSSPKSSFLTAEKRARLRINPVKVRFAEEVIVNGHTQGNSLLFMPNVLKVYLENGQTKAFKFEKKTTVKDIVLTLKEKLSINIIEHFALALEEQYNISKLYLLHDDELIEKVVQKRESHDYRCLFRVCFVPKDPLDLLQEDPVAFEYLYLQSCSDVLQERFAVEMKCSVALRLAALHIQERIYSCGQPQKISFKYIEKEWGIDSFLSPTLLRNMRGKDIKKAISFHIKRNQCNLEPRQKQPISAAQVRLNYLKILGDLKTYGGKIFNATLMLQDRESYVTLLVGAKYGISQIINNKLNIMTNLAEFANISRIELTPESDKVSLVKVYLQDVKPLSLLLESNSAKDIACLVSGYCKLFVDSGASIFVWPGNSQVHRLSTEEGYESRACSDSEESSEVESSSDLHYQKYNSIKPLYEEEEEEEEEEDTEAIHGVYQDRQKKDSGVSEREYCDGKSNDTDSISEASDSANTESHGYKISWSSDSIDALEEDDLETCSSSKPEFFQFYTPNLKALSPEDQTVFNFNHEPGDKRNLIQESDPLLCMLQLPGSRAETAADNKSPRDSECREEHELPVFSVGCPLMEHNIMEYYSLCTNVSPASSTDKNTPSSPECNSVNNMLDEEQINKMGHLVLNNGVEMLILEPPPGFGDSSSEEEFFDAADRFTPTQISPGSKSLSSTAETKFPYPDNPTSYNLKKPNVLMQNATEKCKKYSKKTTKVLRKRRSFLQTDYTTQVTFPLSPSNSSESMDHVCCYENDAHLFVDSHSPTVSSFKDTEGEPALLETKPLSQHKSMLESKNRTHSPNLIEMEPDTMETKSVTDAVVSSISAIRFRSEDGSHNDKLSLYSVDTNNTSNWSKLEINGRASPSQISLQLDNISCNGQSDFCITPFDLDDNSSLREANILDDFKPELKTTFTDIFENGFKVEDQNKPMYTSLSPDLNGRKSLYFAQSENETSPTINSILKSDANKYENNFDAPKAKISQNSPQNSTSHNSSSENLLLSNGPNDSLSEEERLLRNTEAGLCSNSSNMIRCFTDNSNASPFSPSLNSSQKIVDTLELPYNENEDYSSLLYNTDRYSNEHSPHTKRHLLETEVHTQILTDSTSYVENMGQTQLIPNTHHSEDINTSISKRAGNCTCQLSYASCFRSVDTEVDEEIIPFGGTEISVPRTIPPVSGTILSNGRNHLVSTNNGIGNTTCLKYCEALNQVQILMQESPKGFGKLQDGVLDVQKILELYKNNIETHPKDKCAAYFSEHKTSLCNVSRKLMSSCQKVLRSDQSTEEMYQTVEETFYNLMQMTEVCLQFSSCVKCSKQHIDVQNNLQDLICTYHQFVQAAKKASERENGELHLKLLSRQCTALTAAVFCLTQQFRTLISL